MASRHSSKNDLVRVCLYLRMSSASQEESIDSQRAELLAYATKHGYKIVAEYLDEAISGDDTERRTGFLQMRTDAESGKFDLILAWDQDRLGRWDILDGGYWLRPFRQAGIELETVGQGRIGWTDLTEQLVYSVTQMGKHQFLRDLSRNTTRGILASAKEGRVGTGGSTPLGYCSKDGKVSIVPSEAKIIRLIFREYLKPGASLRSVAGYLNKKRIKPPRAKIWRNSSIRPILARRKYTGTYVFGRSNTGRYFSTRDGEIIPRRKADKTVSAEPIIHENHFEAIIDQETFDKAQAKLAERKTKTAPRTARQYLLSGLVQCGDCGGILGGFLYSAVPAYRCRRHHESGSAVCYFNSIKEAPLVEVVSRKIQDRYTSEAALERLRRKIVKAQERSKPRPRDLSRLRKEIKSLDRKISNGEDAVLDAPPSLRPGLYRKLEDLTTDRDRLKAELLALSGRETRSNGTDHSEIDRAIEALRELGEALSKADPLETKMLLASIITKIRLNFTHEKTPGGRTRNKFSHGTIHVRPDAGGGQGTQSDSTQLNTIG